MPHVNPYTSPEYRAALRAARRDPTHAVEQQAALEQHLRFFAAYQGSSLLRATLAYANPYALVLAQGRAYSGAARPPGLRKMTNKLCFRNALWTAMDHPTWRYAEGYALSFQGEACEHAWVVTPEGVVVDPTWPAPDLAAYYGLTIPVEVVSGIVATQGTYGVLCNDWRNDHVILRTGRIERPTLGVS